MNDLNLVDGSSRSGVLPKRFDELLRGYRPHAGNYDEAALPDGTPRTTWGSLFQSLSGFSVSEIERRVTLAQRQMDLDGVAFNPHDADGGVSRPWSLDPIPMVIQDTEWAKVSQGLEQRAQVADLILLDLLGPQTLLHERVLPPEILFGHPRYFPAYHQLVPRPQRHLHLYAADLARSPDGNWWVTSDRTRSPFGLGYILENRLTASRMLPTAFGQCNVQRLAPFFITLRQTLSSLAKRYQENPRIAIWSKGPKSRAYFEDAFLSRYLGYTLVESEDLAVRDNRVMLKTLGGLLPVEVLLRRVEDAYCDPAELSSEKSYGVSGLLEVIRSGNVSVCNSIGSSLIESPMLHAFLPQACQHLLGEELRLPSVATWWCGRPRSQKYVLEHLDKLIIRRAFRSEDEAPQIPHEMSAADRASLMEQIQAAPADFVGQEQVARSTAPVWQDHQLKPWSLALRAFLVSHEDSYQTLPGALARVSPHPDVLSHNMTSGERSQDVWIVSDKPVPVVSLLTVAGSQIELKRGGTELPSRVADNLFWYGRNLERAEQISRVLRTTLQQSTSEDAASAGIRGLAEACKRAKQFRSDYTLPAGSAAIDAAELTRQVVRGALNPKSTQSLLGIVNAAHASASKVRDRIALDSFRVITELRERFQPAPDDELPLPTDVISLLDSTIASLSAISGLTGESMTRTQGWRFLDMGRRIERAVQTAKIIRSVLPVKADASNVVRSLENCLQICDSFMTYRSRYLSNIQLAAVLDLLILDDSSPRSIAFQLRAIVEHVDALPRPQTQATMASEQRIALSLYNEVRLSDVAILATGDAAGELSALRELLTSVIDDLPSLSDTISGKFLIHAGLQRHFASLSMNESPKTLPSHRDIDR